MSCGSVLRARSRNAELSFELRELVDIDAADDVDDGERPGFARDHGNAVNAVAVRVDVHIDVLLRRAPALVHDRAPARTRQLPADALDVFLGVDALVFEF